MVCAVVSALLIRLSIGNRPYCLSDNLGKFSIIRQNSFPMPAENDIVTVRRKPLVKAVKF